jgi:hypothetical protein
MKKHMLVMNIRFVQIWKISELVSRWKTDIEIFILPFFLASALFSAMFLALENDQNCFLFFFLANLVSMCDVKIYRIRQEKRKKKSETL